MTGITLFLRLERREKKSPLITKIKFAVNPSYNATSDHLHFNMKEVCQSWLKEMFMSRNWPRQTIIIWKRPTLPLGNASAIGSFNK